jgi:hypothetical protein
MYIWFAGIEGAVATVISISESDYILAAYSSAQEQRTGAPTSQWTLIGTPNSTDILSALGDGWTNESVDLPVERSVPASVTARQIRIWVVRNIPGGLSAIESALAAIPDQQARQEAQVEWEFAPYCERRHPMLESIAFSLGLSQEQVDQAFREASTI